LIETIRDIVFIIFFSLGTLVGLVVLIATFLVARTALRVLRSAGRTVENVRTLTDTAVEKVGKPLASGSSIAYGAGSVLGFITGFGRKRRKKDS